MGWVRRSWMEGTAQTATTEGQDRVTRSREGWIHGGGQQPPGQCLMRGVEKDSSQAHADTRAFGRPGGKCVTKVVMESRSPSHASTACTASAVGTAVVSTMIFFVEPVGYSKQPAYVTRIFSMSDHCAGLCHRFDGGAVGPPSPTSSTTGGCTHPRHHQSIINPSSSSFSFLIRSR